MEEAILLVVLFVGAVVSIGRRKSGPDPLYQIPEIRKEPRKAVQMAPEGVIDTQEGYREQIGGSILSDVTVRRDVYNIVNGAGSLNAREDALDALYFRVVNCHHEGAASDLVELITDERLHLRYPDWQGRHGDFRSVQQ